MPDFEKYTIIINYSMRFFYLIAFEAYVTRREVNSPAGINAYVTSGRGFIRKNINKMTMVFYLND